MNSEAKRNHHILPRLYLKGFVIKEPEPFIWVYRRGEAYCPGSERYNISEKNVKNPFVDTLKNAGAELDFYADPKPDGTTDYDSFENKLEDLEKPHNEIFKSLRNHQTLCEEEKRRFSTYIVLMHRRVQAGRDLIKNLLSVKDLYEPTKGLFEKLGWPDTPETRAFIKQKAESMSQHGDYHIQGHNRITAASPESLLLEVLPKMTWTFYVASGLQVFLTGDNPVFIAPCGLMGDKRYSEVSFPISTDIALAASWRAGPAGFVEASPSIIKNINRRAMSKCSEYVYFSQNHEWVVNSLHRYFYEYHPLS